jgi:hypothetical protein
MIDAELKMLNTSINNVLNKIDVLSNEQLNEIPKGFSNNIIWNVAHVLVTQKLLIYGLSNNDMNLDSDFIDRYRKGSFPQHKVLDNEIEFVKSELSNFIKIFKKDISNQIFKSYKTYPTSYNYEITNFNEALVMVNLHYGLHFSTILKLLKEV